MQPVVVGVGGWQVPGVDRRSGNANDSNQTTDQRYVLRSVGKVISVSLETVEGVAGVGLMKRVEVDRLVYNPYRLNGHESRFIDNYGR